MVSDTAHELTPSLLSPLWFTSLFSARFLSLPCTIVVVNRCITQKVSRPAVETRKDDSYKYPLRSASGWTCAVSPPPFLAAVREQHADAVDGNDTSNVDGDANGDTKKLAGYRGHMASLGMLGEGSVNSRLFPTPGKKLMKAVGQAIQVRGIPTSSNFLSALALRFPEFPLNL